MCFVFRQEGREEGKQRERGQRTWGTAYNLIVLGVVQFLAHELVLPLLCGIGRVGGGGRGFVGDAGYDERHGGEYGWARGACCGKLVGADVREVEAAGV